jgi:phasin family protein
MADEIQTAIDTSAEATKAVTAAAVETVKPAAATARKARKPATRKSAAPKAAKTTRRKAKAARPAVRTLKGATSRRKIKAAPVAKAPTAKERTNIVTNTQKNWFAGFGANAAPFQTMFAEAGERQQAAVKRSQKALEELTEVSRGNVEALVDAGKIAVEGARSFGQDVVETSREGLEQAADAVRAFAEAKSPTDFMHLQTEFARAQFDRFVSESSRLTETFVKLAGEAIQPIQSRATLNAERINKLVA